MMPTETWCSRSMPTSWPYPSNVPSKTRVVQRSGLFAWRRRPAFTRHITWAPWATTRSVPSRWRGEQGNEMNQYNNMKIMDSLFALCTSFCRRNSISTLKFRHLLRFSRLAFSILFLCRASSFAPFPTASCHHHQIIGWWTRQSAMPTFTTAIPSSERQEITGGRNLSRFLLVGGRPPRSA